MKINYLIIDDEPIAHKLIENFAKDLNYMSLIGNCYSAMDAVPYLKENKIDLIFLDINMPKLSGFEFLQTLKILPQIIIISAHKEFALESYEYNISDYLLKPFNFERFFKSIQKVMDKIEVDNNSATKDNSDHHIFIKDEKKHHKIDLKDILYIEANGNYALVILTKGQILSQMKISDFENLLPEKEFSRVHRSYMISHSAITLISASEITLGNKIIPVGRVYKSKLDSIIKP